MADEAMDTIMNDSGQTKKNVLFLAKAWINTITKDGANKGKKYMSGNLDNKFKGLIVVFEDTNKKIHKIPVKISDQIQIWPNNKRPNVRDADFRISILTDSELPKDINGQTEKDTETKQDNIQDDIAEMLT